MASSAAEPYGVTFLDKSARALARILGCQNAFDDLRRDGSKLGIGLLLRSPGDRQAFVNAGRIPGQRGGVKAGQC